MSYEEEDTCLSSCTRVDQRGNIVCVSEACCRK